MSGSYTVGTVEGGQTAILQGVDWAVVFRLAQVMEAVHGEVAVTEETMWGLKHELLDWKEIGT